MFENNFTFFDKTKLKFKELYDTTKDFLIKKYNQNGKIFTTASPFGQLLEVVLNLGRLMFFYIEDSITELNILTAQRESSIRGLASLVGHQATRPISASGSINIIPKRVDISNIPNGNINILNLTKIKNKKNGLTYTIILPNDYIKIRVGVKDFVTLSIVEGVFQKSEFVSTGKPLESFNVEVRNRKKIEQFHINVFVNNRPYKIFESLYDMGRDVEGCLVKNSITNNGISVYFGNGQFGKIPKEGSLISIEYLLTNGSLGNILERGSFDNWNFVDVGYTDFGDEIDLNEFFEIKMNSLITMGSDGESIEMTRMLAPKTSRNLVLVNPENYKNFFESFGFFSLVDAFTTFDDNFLDDNIVYLFFIPDVKKRVTNSLDYFNIPLDYFILNESEKQKIEEFLEKSGKKMITTDVIILDAQIKKYVLNISLIVFEGYDIQTIKTNIVSEIGKYMLENKRRDRIPKSDFIRIIENIDGVDSVNVWFISEENELNKIQNPNSTDILGLDEFGDIIIKKNEIPVIRGGFKDRNGVFYEDSTNFDKPSAINISISKIIPKQNF